MEKGRILSRLLKGGCIWHMGFADNDFRGGGYSVGNAFEKFPLAVLLHIADLQATYLDETGEKA